MVQSLLKKVISQVQKPKLETHADKQAVLTKGVAGTSNTKVTQGAKATNPNTASHAAASNSKTRRELPYVMGQRGPPPYDKWGSSLKVARDSTKEEREEGKEEGKKGKEERKEEGKEEEKPRGRTRKPWRRSRQKQPLLTVGCLSPLATGGFGIEPVGPSHSYIEPKDRNLQLQRKQLERLKGKEIIWDDASQYYQRWYNPGDVVKFSFAEDGDNQVRIGEDGLQNLTLKGTSSQANFKRL